MGQAKPVWPVRRYRPDDKNRILSDWGHTNRSAEKDLRWVSRSAYDRHHANLEALLHTADVYVACDQEKDSVIYGWIVADVEFDTLHMAFVRYDFRRNGIGTTLLRHVFPDESRGLSYTHRTKDIKLVKDAWNLARFAPELIGR